MSQQFVPQPVFDRGITRQVIFQDNVYNISKSNRKSIQRYHYHNIRSVGLPTLPWIHDRLGKPSSFQIWSPLLGLLLNRIFFISSTRGQPLAIAYLSDA